MMRRMIVAAALIVGASVASAQMPPSISKPIEQARKAANATNAQMAQVNQQAAPASIQQAKSPAPAAKAPAPGKKAPVPGTKAPAPALKAPASEATPQQAKVDSNKVTFEREVFTYVASEVDPFASPMETGAIRPLVSDLKVVGIIYDPTGHNSVAVMRDQSTTLQYRAKVGQVLGRAKVTQIKPQEVILSIEEYGFSRQTSLKLNVQQTQQTKGKP
jgi:hypothetical protein